MEITTKTIIFAIISIILIAAILGGVFYLLKNSKQIISTDKNSNPLSRLETVTNSPTPTPSISKNPTLPVTNNQIVAPVSTKVYQGGNFTINYPQKWGIVTCNNSQNFELDPYNSTDLKNYSCDRAIKPITILVSNSALNCSGDTVKIGNSTVIKSKTVTANWLKNRWCVNKNGVSLDITNRVAPSGTGTGKDDFSSQIEQIISGL